MSGVPYAALVEHLRELRSRLVKALLGLLAGFIACYLVSDTLLDLIAAPLKGQLPPHSTMIFTSLPEVFFVQMHVAFVAALFLTSPYTLYQLWSFVAPGLYQQERRFFLFFLSSSIILFAVGGSFAYFLVMPTAFKFFLGFATPTLAAYPSLQSYISLVLQFVMAFGIAFETPLVCIMLAKLGVVSAEAMARQRRWALVGAFVLGAVLTPPDVFSQFMLAVPLYALYEIGIFLSRRIAPAV